MSIISYIDSYLIGKAQKLVLWEESKKSLGKLLFLDIFNSLNIISILPHVTTIIGATMYFQEIIEKPNMMMILTFVIIVSDLFNRIFLFLYVKNTKNDGDKNTLPKAIITRRKQRFEFFLSFFAYFFLLYIISGVKEVKYEDTQEVFIFVMTLFIGNFNSLVIEYLLCTTTPTKEKLGLFSFCSNIN